MEKTYFDVLESLGACTDALLKRRTVSIEEAIASPERGDWLLWLAAKLDLDHRRIMLAKLRIAANVRFLITDIRTLHSLDVAEQYALGKATESELKSATTAAMLAGDELLVSNFSATAEATLAANCAVARAPHVAATTVTAVGIAMAAYYIKERTSDSFYPYSPLGRIVIRDSLKLSGYICAEVLGAELIAAVNQRLAKDG